MGKLGNFLVCTAFLAVLVGIGMVAVQGQGTLVIHDFDLAYLSRVRKVQIENLRDLVKGIVTHEYMLEDAFLLKWLLDQDFNVNQAAELIQQNLKWRADQKIDTIMEENWGDIKSVLPYSRNTTDKFGRPLIYFDYGEWNVAKLISEMDSGRDRFERFFYMIWEEDEKHVRELQAGGQNVTQSVLMVNVEKFSVGKQGCIQCLQAYRNIGLTIASNYPWTIERNLFVNVPYLFEVAFNYISDKNKRKMNILGSDKSVWEQEILKTIKRDQIPGGLVEYHSM